MLYGLFYFFIILHRKFRICHGNYSIYPFRLLLFTLKLLNFGKLSYQLICVIKKKILKTIRTKKKFN